MSALFTEVELEFLKRRFDVQFGQAPAVLDGIFVEDVEVWTRKGPTENTHRNRIAAQSQPNDSGFYGRQNACC